MCGIAGAWEFKDKVDQDALKAMRDCMRHRGPDDAGLYIEPRGQLGLAHQRLSILDLSAGGHQPMTRGNFTVTYNGEIYNFKEIRQELEQEGVVFTSTSDTEVLLYAWEQWGQEAVQKFRGMFVFALWDAKSRTLTLCRDRAGVKPLYYYFDRERFLFASELEPLARHPTIVREVDPEAAALFLWLGYIPSPVSIFKGIRKLEAGHFLTVTDDGSTTKRKYWDIADGARHREPRSGSELLDHTETVLTEAFTLRMVSDVPVGVFLSGGIDSTLVATLLMKDAVHPLKTFTVGFEDPKYDEAAAASALAKHLGTEHHELYLSHKKGAEIVERLPGMFGEPYGGSSAIPTFLVSEFARECVTVALSADGGDELFCGYGDKYPRTAAIIDKYAAIGWPLKALASLPGARLLDPRLELLGAAGQIGRFYSLLNKRLFSYGEVPSLLTKPVGNFAQSYWDHFKGTEGLETAERVALFDAKTFLADSILTKVDRASMAVSLESREPFLDPKVMELAASIPTDQKYQQGESKYLLKQILYRHIPRELVDRPKHGFSMPIRELLMAGSPPNLERYLGERKGGLLNPEALRREKERFLKGASPRRVWLLVVLRMWEEYWGL